MKNDQAPAQSRTDLEAAAFTARQAIHALITKGKPIGAELQRLIDDWHLAAGYARALMLDDEPTFADPFYMRGYLAAKKDLLTIEIPVVQPPAVPAESRRWQLSGGMCA